MKPNFNFSKETPYKRLDYLVGYGATKQTEWCMADAVRCGQMAIDCSVEMVV